MANAENKKKELPKKVPNEEKRIKQSRLAYERNKAKRTRVRNAVKKFNDSLNAGLLSEVELKTMLCETISIINKASSDGIYHKNTASRKVGNISRAYSTKFSK